MLGLVLSLSRGVGSWSIPILTLFFDQNGAPAPASRPGQQYNNPAGLYSDESIKDILNQQAETLATGVKG